MRKLQSLIALFGVIAITGAFSSLSAKATVLTSDVHALNAEQTSFVDKAYYSAYHRRYYRRGFYDRRYYGGYYRRGYYGYGYHHRRSGGAMAIATAAGGTKSQRLKNQKRQDLIPGAFLWSDGSPR